MAITIGKGRIVHFTAADQGTALLMGLWIRGITWAGTTTGSLLLSDPVSGLLLAALSAPAVGTVTETWVPKGSFWPNGFSVTAMGGGDALVYLK